MREVFTHPAAVAAFPFVERVEETGDPIVMLMRLPRELSDHGTNPMGTFSLEVAQRNGRRVVEASWTTTPQGITLPAPRSFGGWSEPEEPRVRVARWTLQALALRGVPPLPSLTPQPLVPPD